MTNIEKILGLVNSIEGNEEIKNQILALMEQEQKDIIKKAISQLSYTELAAVKAVLQDGKAEKTFVASKVSTENSITRSIIVTALDKMSTAGIIVTKSMGVKGMYLKVMKTEVFDILENF